MKTPIQNVVVLGGGSAGFIAALTLKRRLPHLLVRVVRSPDIGVIGVGEGTTQLFPKFFFQQLRLKPAQFYAELQPTWKLGIRFIWGPRQHFHYTFSPMIDRRLVTLPKNHGYYCNEEFSGIDLWSALMEEDKALPRDSAGKPFFAEHAHLGFHVENHRLVAYLEARCRDFGVVITDGTVERVEHGSDGGIAALLLKGGERVCGDLYVDASGFRSELIGGAMKTPFRDYTDTLFCDRAVIGGWNRTHEPLKPYTTAETMDAGWAWQIEHEHFINRGYVYSSRFVADEAALVEFRSKNPQVTTTPRMVKFRTGRYAHMWRKNVIGIGNATGFVEPLEASALQVIIIQARTLGDLLVESECAPTPGAIDVYDRFIQQHWDDVRDFLAVHYRFNTRLDTPFWKAARADTALHAAQPIVDFYRENGPSSFARSMQFSPNNPYGLEGYLVMLVGQKVPHARQHAPSDKEIKLWNEHLKDFKIAAKRGFDSVQALKAIRTPGWQWG